MTELIKARLNKNVLLKSLLIGGLTPVSGIILHIIKQRLFLPGNPPPDAQFLIAVSGLFFIMGFLFAVGFFLFRPEMPGRKNYIKALVFALLVNATAFSPNIIGMIAFDFTGKFDLFTNVKLENYATTAADFINICLIGLITGFLSRSQDKTVGQMPKKNRTRLLPAVFFGAVLFPASCALLFFIADSLLSRVFNIPDHAKLWFYSGLFVPLCLTGGVLPVFYRFAGRALSGNWIKKGISFTALFVLLFWLVCIVFVIPFGYSIWIALFFIGVTVPPLVFVVLLSARLFISDKAGAAPV
ncbi:MAG: hypothetical protein JW822_09460 [Spirochaetales bacterium]|nr:hypothetical protein [Spirochaetales bacterium]